MPNQSILINPRREVSDFPSTTRGEYNHELFLKLEFGNWL